MNEGEEGTRERRRFKEKVNRKKCCMGMVEGGKGTERKD
jgi:hypothetical protein